MDRHLFDILWEVYRDVDGKKPIQIISAYRSPATNAMLHRRSSGVARHSQHMLGHAMDFYIPDVALENIRAAGLRLQRGGVGFYPTSGSPFVHLDTGSVRHWPRMTHDQLAKVFPDGRTVHQSSSGPMKGYELARADIERRGNGDDAASVGKKPSLFAALFRGGKSTEEDDEGASAPARNEKSAPASVVAAAAKSANPVPTPRSKPQVAATLQLASADAQIVPAPKGKSDPKQDQKQAAQASAEPKPQTPADIINSRGFWDDVPKAANEATPAQVASLRAARFSPPHRSAVDRPRRPIVQQGDGLCASRGFAGRSRQRRRRHRTTPVASARPARNAGAAATEINTVVAKGAQGQDSVVATSTRLAAAQGNSIWMRVVMLAPSASSAMSTTVLGDTEMTQMRSHFVKPQAAIPMTFSEDPMMGMTCDRFTGSATAQLPTQSFVMRTAALR